MALKIKTREEAIAVLRDMVRRKKDADKILTWFGL